jgi:hypothetical protein
MSEINLKKGELFAILQQVVFLKSMIKKPVKSSGSENGSDSSIGLANDDSEFVLDPFGDTNCLHSASSTTLSKNRDF